MSTSTVLHQLHENARNIPNKPAYYEKVDGTWQPTNWSDYLQQVRQAARALIALGMDTGDIVSILGFNTPEWVIMDLFWKTRISGQKLTKSGPTCPTFSMW